MKEFGLIGKRLTHSFSKRYFTQKFLKEQLKDHYYELFELEEIAYLPVLLQKHRHLQGFSVTIPYKEVILPFMTTLDPPAAAMGAVNVVRVERKDETILLHGFNTDYLGFMTTLSKEAWGRIEHAVVLGNGGASQAVQYALQLLQIPFLVVSRGGATAHHPHLISYTELTETLVEATSLVVNTTPLGMYPEINSAPTLPYHALSKRHTLIDLVYNPDDTLFMQKGFAQGATVHNGLKMLYAQADEAWKVFNTNIQK